MRKKPSEAIRALRKTLGLTQAEFAVMIGASKDAVVSWETGRNQLSAAFARRIALVTGVDGRMLQLGVGVPFSNSASGEAKAYTAEDFERHRQTEWGGTGEEGARRQLEHCHDTMELLLRAAARAGGEKIRHRLPGVMDSFIQWCQSTREDFQLGPQIDEQLAKRRRRAGVTQECRDWRAMARGDAEALKAAGFKDDPTKGDRDTLRLELKLVPEWSPGRSMKWPRPAAMKLAGGKAKKLKAESRKPRKR